jgi:hypothetical protein
VANPSLWSQAGWDLRKWFYIVWHRLSGREFTLATVIDVLARFGYVTFPIFSAYKFQSWSWLSLYVLLLVFIKKRELSPENLQFIKDGYPERKALIASAIQLLANAARAGRRLTDREREVIQTLALDTIVSYVSGHRSDTKRLRIFASLAVEDGDDIVVIRRDSKCTRPVPNKHAKKDSLVWHAISQRAVKYTGDAKKEFADSIPAGKGYTSIVVFPVMSDASSPALGAVSVDSSLPFHFDTYQNDLQTFLLPYVNLIAATLQ